MYLLALTFHNALRHLPRSPIDADVLHAHADDFLTVSRSSKGTQNYDRLPAVRFCQYRRKLQPFTACLTVSSSGRYIINIPASCTQLSQIPDVLHASAGYRRGSNLSPYPAVLRCRWRMLRETASQSLLPSYSWVAHGIGRV